MSQDTRRITDYYLIRVTNAPITGAVMDMIAEGWQPFGRPFAYDDERADTILAQAMVKYEILPAPTA